MQLIIDITLAQINAALLDLDERLRIIESAVLELQKEMEEK